jgi:hypothetical protein
MLRLLERKVIELNIVDHASDNTIGRVLKKQAQASPQTTIGHPAASKQRICELRWRDVLAVYKRPRDRDYPLVCLDEISQQMPG